MKLSLFATAAAAALTFQIMTMRSGTPYQGGHLGSSSDKVVYGAGSEIKFVLNGDGSLADKNLKKYLVVEDGKFVLSDKAQRDFTLNADRLAYKGAPSFGICPDDGDTIEFNGTCSNYTGLALQAVDKSFSLGYHPGSLDLPWDKSSTAASTETPHTTIA